MFWQNKQHCAVPPDTHYCTSDKTWQELLCLPCLVLPCWGRAGVWGMTCMRSVLANLLFFLLGCTFINKALFILRAFFFFFLFDYSLAVTSTTVNGLLVFLPQTHLNIWHKKSNNTALEKPPMMLLPLQLLWGWFPKAFLLPSTVHGLNQAAVKLKSWQPIWENNLPVFSCHVTKKVYLFLL